MSTEPLSEKNYCNSLTRYSRYKTREVKLGDIPMGNFHPVRIQSMTTTDTMNTRATVEQTIRMVNAGCEFVRITAPSINEAKNLANIKKELRARGYAVPLIADIHFTPNAAEYAARVVEKVRVNPGNYADKKRFDVIEYTDSEYEAELERIRQKFTPLVRVCKEYGTAMRVGTNHGSLSDRIMSRYGDTPLGMVESALEFVRICESLRYYNIVLSMKASNPQVMVQAYRLLVNRMEAEGMNYPLHLGVTEAGDGEDGRIKSALGIGTLLEDGLGDTIRVSLTEEPEFEAPVAIALTENYKNRETHAPIPPIDKIFIDPFIYRRRESHELLNFGGSNVPRVTADFSRGGVKHPSELAAIGYFYDEITDKWTISDSAADYIFTGTQALEVELPPGLQRIYDFETTEQPNDLRAYPMIPADIFLAGYDHASLCVFVACTINDLSPDFLERLKVRPNTVIVLSSENTHAMPELRRAFLIFIENGITAPVIIKREYCDLSSEQFVLKASTDIGALLIDGFGDGVFISDDSSPARYTLLNRAAFGILQAARTRITKTEYIACPSCGRTLFDLVETTEKIRKRTAHLKGVKIAIMGCIVNGPGEMADADYGYVGSGPDRITLYRGKEVIRKSVPSTDAVDELISLIRENGQWVEPAAISPPPPEDAKLN